MRKPPRNFVLGLLDAERCAPGGVVEVRTAGTPFDVKIRAMLFEDAERWTVVRIETANHALLSGRVAARHLDIRHNLSAPIWRLYGGDCLVLQLQNDAGVAMVPKVTLVCRRIRRNPL